MVFRLEVWNGFPTGEVLSTVELPDEATAAEKDALGLGAKSTAEQMLGKLGVKAHLYVIVTEHAMTDAEMKTELERAHAREAAGETLPNTDEVLNRLV